MGGGKKGFAAIDRVLQSMVGNHEEFFNGVDSAHDSANAIAYFDLGDVLEGSIFHFDFGSCNKAAGTGTGTGIVASTNRGIGVGSFVVLTGKRAILTTTYKNMGEGRARVWGKGERDGGSARARISGNTRWRYRHY